MGKQFRSGFKALASAAKFIGGVPVKLTRMGEASRAYRTRRARRTAAVMALKTGQAQFESLSRKQKSSPRLSRAVIEAALQYRRYGGSVDNALNILDHGYPIVERRECLGDLVICKLQDAGLAERVAGLEWNRSAGILTFSNRLTEGEKEAMEGLIAGMETQWLTPKRVKFWVPGLRFSEQDEKPMTTDKDAPKSYDTGAETIPPSDDDAADDRPKDADDPGVKASDTGDVGPSADTQEV